MTTLTITRSDSTVDVLTVPGGSGGDFTYSTMIQNIQRGGGYFADAAKSIWVPYNQIKTIVAS